MLVVRGHHFGALLLAACVILAVGASPVFAAGYTDWSEVATLPGNGTSPHGGYTASTQKCSVCHAVHQADAAGELLLQSSAADACVYCHISTAVSSLQVYDGDPANYSGTDFDNAHNFGFPSGSGDGWPGVKCTTCHQVHASDNQMTENAFLTQKILRGDKTYTGTNYDPVAQQPLSTDDKDTALTKWCAGCHFTTQIIAGSSSYYSNDYNEATHIMTTATVAYSNPLASYTGQVAWKDSTYCMSCHGSDYGVSSAWPHYTAGDKFLVSAATSVDATLATTDSSEDGVCLRCHRDGSTSGAGLDY
ncbi:MAG: hypothetical protein PF636_09740 [Actinomycetota bacterium]|nr:hypothetical protein [Actinomycetota bacterium]